MDYDVAVIGAGPGGYSAAVKASRAGLKTCLIDKEKIGGTCLNKGCIPTKSLLSSSGLYKSILSSASHGIDVQGVSIDISRMAARKNDIIDKLAKGMHTVVSNSGVTFIKGRAFIKDKNCIAVDTESGSLEISAKNIIISSGSVPAIPRFIPYDGKTVCSSDDILTLDSIPDSIAIIGGGVIGCEFATLFSNLGSKVTIIELLPSILSNFDEDIVKYASRIFKKDGIEIIAENAVKDVIVGNSSVQLILSDGRKIEASKVLVSVGRKAASENLGLQNVGIAVEPKSHKIIVNNKMQTNVDGIYAIGDICSSPYDLAHSASEEGTVAVENILGNNASMDYSSIPSCVYTDPEIASVGLTENDAKSAGMDFISGKAFFAGNGKALADSHTDGFVKLVADKKTLHLVGAHVIGHHASDIIGELTVLVKNKASLDYIGSTVHAHPTLYEIIHEAAVNLMQSI